MSNIDILDIQNIQDEEDDNFDEEYDRAHDMGYDAYLDEMIAKEGEDGLPLLGDHE